MHHLVEQLVEAAKAGQTQLCRDLVAQGSPVDYQTSAWKYTALCRACEAGHKDTAEALLELGASVDFCETGRWTPLHRAAARNHAAICEMLIDRGADIHAKSSTNETPLNCAASNGHMEASIFLLDRGANIEARDEAQRTPLIQVCARGSWRIAEEFLKRGADTEATDQFGSNALAIAMMNSRLGGRGDLRAGLIVIAYGGDPSRADAPVNTFEPAQAAAMGGFSGRLLQVLDSAPHWREPAKLQALRQLALDNGHEDTVATLDSSIALAAIQRAIAARSSIAP